jgi:hypothetical protein
MIGWLILLGQTAIGQNTQDQHDDFAHGFCLRFDAREAVT